MDGSRSAPADIHSACFAASPSFPKAACGNMRAAATTHADNFVTMDVLLSSEPGLLGRGQNLRLNAASRTVFRSHSRGRKTFSARLLISRLRFLIYFSPRHRAVRAAPSGARECGRRRVSGCPRTHVAQWRMWL